MKSPTNYAEWCNLMDTITGDIRDEAYIDIIRGGTISWSSGVAERFIKTVADMVRNRINAAQDKCQAQIKNARDNMNALVAALQTLKKEYIYDYAMMSVLPVPEDIRKEMTQMVQDQADQTAQSLEKSASSDRTGHLRVTIKNIHINNLNG